MSTRVDQLIIKNYRISSDLLEKKFVADGGPCACSSGCCTWGVFVDIRERDTILQHKDAIIGQMDDTQTKDSDRWFDTSVDEDPDYPSGYCVGTETHGNKCVFLRNNGQCSIQAAAVAGGLHKWSWKPMYCVLYPLEISSGEVMFDPIPQDENACCNLTDRQGIPLFMGCEEELVYLLGRDGYSALEHRYRAMSKKETTECA